MWGYIATFVGGVAIGIVVDKLVEKVKMDTKIKFSEALEECFGEPMYTNCFTLKDVRDWLKSREELLCENTKAVIMKAKPEILKEFESSLDFSNGAENTLIIAIVDSEEKKIVASLLVKYEKLDDTLENALAKGNGMMVVEK